VIYLAIDPGVRKSAVCRFGDTSAIESCLYIESGETANADPILHARAQVAQARHLYGDRLAVYIERPQVYGGARAKGDPNDLINLAMVVGAFSGLAGERLVSFHPQAWKGQVPKETHHMRIGTYLRTMALPGELKVWESCCRLKGDHDLRDAVGLALFASRRLGRGGERT